MFTFILLILTIKEFTKHVVLDALHPLDPSRSILRHVGAMFPPVHAVTRLLLLRPDLEGIIKVVARSRFDRQHWFGIATDILCSRIGYVSLVLGG